MGFSPVTELLVLFFRVHAALRGAGPGKRPWPEQVRRVLLVSTTGLGDTVLSTPAVAAAREAWPEAEIYFLVKKEWAGLFSACPRLNGLALYPGKFKNLRALLRQLRDLDPDLALILHGNDPDIVPLAYLSGRPFLVCRDSVRFDFLLDQGVGLADPDRHIAERRLDVVRAAAGPLASRPPEIFVPEDKRAWAVRHWADLGLEPGQRLLALNPGGSRQPKRWPDEHWRDLIGRLSKVKGLGLAMFGSPAERTLLEDLAGAPDRKPVLFVTRNDLLETAALLERAEVLIGPDSGLVHLASALGLKVLVLFGPDNPVLSGPFMTRSPAAVLQADRSVCPDIAACHKKVCRPNVCLAEITPDRVLAALKADLEFPLDFYMKIE